MLHGGHNVKPAVVAAKTRTNLQRNIQSGAHAERPEYALEDRTMTWRACSHSLLTIAMFFHMLLPFYKEPVSEKHGQGRRSKG